MDTQPQEVADKITQLVHTLCAMLWYLHCRSSLCLATHALSRLLEEARESSAAAGPIVPETIQALLVDSALAAVKWVARMFDVKEIHRVPDHILTVCCCLASSSCSFVLLCCAFRFQLMFVMLLLLGTNSIPIRSNLIQISTRQSPSKFQSNPIPSHPIQSNQNPIQSNAQCECRDTC